MGDGFQPLALLGVREDHRAESFPVEVAVGLQHLAAEFRHDGAMRGLARRHHLAGELVGVGDTGAEMREHGAHRALAGGDAAGEPGEEEGPGALTPRPSPLPP